MNGCCPTHADSIYHGEECYWYWPCGCPKKRSNESKLKPHKHVFQGASSPPERQGDAIDGGDGQEEAREDINRPDKSLAWTGKKWAMKPPRFRIVKVVWKVVAR